MIYRDIPTWEECNQLVNNIDNGLEEALDPIQQMILNNEPSDPNHAKGFRDDFQKVIDYLVE
jgi:hypothetical protein